jgi:putative transposase
MGVSMAMGRPKAALVLRPEQREQLEGMASSRSLPAGLVSRARIILLSASGKTNLQIARHMGLTNATVGKWRRRFLEQDVSGLHDELRPGRPRPISDERVARLVRKTLETKPKDGTHWTIRQIAEETRVSKSTVHRIWQAFGLEPHRQKHFKLSTDPFFVEKVRDIVGLYLNPPENAVVLCVDEKSQIQALERTQPMLPMGLGYVEGVTHNYRRHGTTTLFAALDTAKGKVLMQCRPRHRHQEYLGSPKRDREERAGGIECAHHRGQLRHTQTPASKTLARSTATIPRALQSDLCLMAQSSRHLVQPDYATGHSPRDISQRQGTGRENRSIRANFKQPRAALRLDRHRGFDLR